MTEVCQDNVHALELSVIMTLKRSPIRSGGKYLKSIQSLGDNQVTYQ